MTVKPPEPGANSPVRKAATRCRPWNPSVLDESTARFRHTAIAAISHAAGFRCDDIDQPLAESANVKAAAAPDMRATRRTNP